MRPPMGAGSHHQPQSKPNSVSFMMSLYTIGIIALSVYTLMKIVCKKSPVTPYTEVKPDPKFRQQVFDQENDDQIIKRPDDGSTKLGEILKNLFLFCKYFTDLDFSICFLSFNYRVKQHI